MRTRRHGVSRVARLTGGEQVYPLRGLTDVSISWDDVADELSITWSDGGDVGGDSAYPLRIQFIHNGTGYVTTDLVSATAGELSTVLIGTGWTETDIVSIRIHRYNGADTSAWAYAAENPLTLA